MVHKKVNFLHKKSQHFDETCRKILTKKKLKIINQPFWKNSEEKKILKDLLKKLN